MRTFIQQITLFTSIFILLIVIGVLLPTTPRASRSLFMGSIKKDSLLEYTPAPRMIFIGGSNVSFGLNSQLIKDSLGINPINTAIHVSIGLKYMLESTLGYVKAGDIIVLIPEYNHFFAAVHKPSEELLRVILDVDYSRLKHLTPMQGINLLRFLPKYALSKYKITEYLNQKVRPAYSAHAFNQFGDTYAHWNLPPVGFDPYTKIKQPFNPKVIALIKQYEAAVRKKHAVLYVSYPCLQATSFQNLSTNIHTVAHALEESGLPLLGTPDQFKMADSLCFDTPYHLTYAGVNLRTQQLFQDLKLHVSSN